MPEPLLDTIDTAVLAAFQKRFQQVFNCVCVYTNVHEKTKTLERLFEGKPVEYPYAFLIIGSVSRSTNSYNSHSMGRRGLPMNVPDGGGIKTVRMIPVDITVRVEYVTNKFQSKEQGSVMSFIRRWMMASRFGYTKSQIKYGRIVLGINTTLDESLTVPERENVVENESAYPPVSGNIIIHGYMSDPQLGHQGKVEQLDVTEFYSAMPNARFFPFNRS